MKQFFTFYGRNGYYYTAVVDEGIKIYDMTRKELFCLWWSAFSAWVRRRE